MAYPSGIKVFIDGVDATAFIFGVPVFNPDSLHNTFKDINITSYLRKIERKTITPHNEKGEIFPPQEHLIEITAADGNGRVECRLEIR